MNSSDGTTATTQASNGGSAGAKSIQIDATPRATKGAANRELSHIHNKPAVRNSQRHLHVAAVDEEALSPLYVAGKLVDFPCRICCCLFVFIAILAAIDMVEFGLSDEDDRTWMVQDSTEVERYDIWTLGEEALSDAGGDNLYLDPQTEEESGWTVFWMFETQGYNKNPIDEDDLNATDYWILTPENLEVILYYEELVTQDDEWKNKFCYVEDTSTYECSYTSLARDIAVFFDYDFDSMSTEGIKEYVLDFYHTTDSPGTVESAFNQQFAATNQTYLYRSFLDAGVPVTTNLTVRGSDNVTIRKSKYRNSNHQSDAQQEKYLDWSDELWQDYSVDEEADLTEGDLRIIYLEGVSFNNQFNTLILEGMVWVVVAVVAVLAWVTVHLQSFFLSSAALGEILLSFPFAWFFYRYVFQIVHFDSLSLLIIFVLLGVGADDVFVFTDAWRQSLHFVKDRTNLKQRMSFAYRRAAKAMLVTQATTFFCFLATAFSRIMPISAFGYWASCIVVCNYLLVISMYPALILIHHRWVRPWERKHCCCCCPDDGEEELNNAGGSGSKAMSPREKQRAQDKKQNPNSDENIELTTHSKMSPHHVSPHDEDGDEKNDAGEGVVPPLARRQSTVEEMSVDYGKLEQFFAVTWAKWIQRAKEAILVGFVILFALAVWRAVNIEEQDEDEQWFDDDHYMTRTSDLSNKFTSSEQSGLAYIITLWGAKSINRDGTSFWDPEDYGKIKWDNNFDISSYEAQAYFDEKCHNLSETDLVFQETSVTCVFDYFKDYLDEIGESFPWNYTDYNDTSFNAETQKQEFALKLYNFSQSSHASIINQDSLLWVQAPVDNKDNEFYVRYIAIGAYSPLRSDDSIAVAEDAQDDWDAWVRDNFNQNDDCPEGIDNPFQLSRRWCSLITNREFVLSAIQGIAIALPLAFVVLIISTQNWIMAIYATFDIIGVMACELAVMEVCGWKFGISESVAVVIVIGFSVDYVVHLANAYLESQGGIRQERVSFALLTMGISVVSGAITTFLAGIFLTFPAVLLFYKMGILIMTTIAFSLAWSMMFFISLLSLAGPQFDTGNIPFRKWYDAMTNCCKS